MTELEAQFKLILKERKLVQQLSSVGVHIWMQSKNGHYCLSKEELDALERLIVKMRNENLQLSSEAQMREFCGYVTGYLYELRDTHPGMVWAAWQSYLNAASQIR